MTADNLLAQLEPLTHAARMRHMVGLGRASHRDAGVARTLAALEHGGFYERLLALMACAGSGDGTHVLRALDDPSRTIRAHAALLVPTLCDDEQATQALVMLPSRQRRHLATRLRRRRRAVPIDQAMTRLEGPGDPRVEDLLPYCSAAVVTSRLSAVAEGAGLSFWTRLTRQHPDIVAQALLQRTAEESGDDRRLRWHVGAVLPLLAERRPDAAFALLQALAPRGGLGPLSPDAVLLRRPEATLDLILGLDYPFTLRLDRVVHRLDAERLCAALARLPGADEAIAHRFRYLRPAVREAVYLAGGPGWRDGEGCVDVEMVRCLPGPLRTAEARRHLQLPVLATRPLQRLPYAGLLPWDEAEAVLTPALGSPDTDVRGAALAALAATVRHDRARAASLLAVARARRNEQDPVRLALLGAIAALPPSVWRAKHLEDLGQVLRAALDAADLSPASATEAGKVVARLLPFHPGWAAPWLSTLVRERGQLPSVDLERAITDADMARIGPLLLPVLRDWAARERWQPLLAVARALGRRLRLFAELGEILEQISHTTRNAWVADGALALLQRQQPARFAALIPALLREDESVATLGTVWRYLDRRRQDLLTPYLGQRAYQGRFATGATRIVLPFSSGFARWTPTQQHTFAHTLREMTHRNPTVQDTPTILRGITQLAGLPAVPPQELLRLTRRTQPAVRDAALRALGRLDDATAAVPALLAAMDDDRARVAVYALRRALLGMAPQRAMAVLREVPLERVTVAKEVVRLYGELPIDEAFAALQALYGRPDLHRDVRVATLRALWGHLEQVDAWTLLEEAAASPDPALARSLVRLPADRLSLAAQRRLVHLLTTLLAHPDPRVRLETAERCAALPVADPERLLLHRIVVHLASALPDECTAAATAAVALSQPQDAPEITAAIGALLPRRRALLSIVEAFATTSDARRLQPVVRVILETLATDPLTATLQVRLTVHVLPWSEAGDWLQRLAGEGSLHADALTMAATALSAPHRIVDVEGLAGLETRLAASPDPALRRLGLAALVGLAWPPRGWTAERLSRLHTYRADPAALVAAAAQFTLLPDEMDPS